MQKTPLGMHENEYDKRNSGYNYWKQFKHWRMGYKAAKKGRTKADCPYKLTTEQLELLKKRTRWFMGWEQAAYTPSKKQLRAEKERKHGKSDKHDRHRKKKKH